MGYLLQDRQEGRSGQASASSAGRISLHEAPGGSCGISLALSADMAVGCCCGEASLPSGHIDRQTDIYIGRQTDRHPDSRIHQQTLQQLAAACQQHDRMSLHFTSQGQGDKGAGGCLRCRGADQPVIGQIKRWKQRSQAAETCGISKWHAHGFS